jgi:hypothetical protein
MTPDALLARITPDAVGGDGAGVRAAVIDCGIDGRAQALRGRVAGGVVIREAPRPARKSWAGRAEFRVGPYTGQDADPHATTAAAAIVQAAPAVELIAVDIGPPRWEASLEAVIEGLRGAVKAGCGVIYVGGGAARAGVVVARRYHLADAVEQAYRAGAVVVAGAHPDHPTAAAIPATFAVSVSVNRGLPTDTPAFLYRLNAGIEYEADARGRADGVDAVSASFAAARVAGWVCRIRSRCPELRPFEVKTVLYRLAEWYRLRSQA